MRFPFIFRSDVLTFKLFAPQWNIICKLHLSFLHGIYFLSSPKPLETTCLRNLHKHMETSNITVAAKCRCSQQVVAKTILPGLSWRHDRVDRIVWNGLHYVVARCHNTCSIDKQSKNIRKHMCHTSVFCVSSMFFCFYVRAGCWSIATVTSKHITQTWSRKCRPAINPTRLGISFANIIRFVIKVVCDGSVSEIATHCFTQPPVGNKLLLWLWSVFLRVFLLLSVTDGFFVHLC